MLNVTHFPRWNDYANHDGIQDGNNCHALQKISRKQDSYFDGNYQKYSEAIKGDADDKQNSESNALAGLCS